MNKDQGCLYLHIVQSVRCTRAHWSQGLESHLLREPEKRPCILMGASRARDASDKDSSSTTG